jgi:hypothetical protein
MKENALRAGRVNKIESKVTRMIALMIIGMYDLNNEISFCHQKS